MSKLKPLRVESLINFRDGTPHTSFDFLSLEEGRQIELRKELTRCYRHGEKYLVCGYCRGPLCLKGGSDQGNKQRLHFFHLPSPESESCPLHRGEKISKDVMRAIIYDGVKESPCHKEMKETIGSILSRDTGRCRDVYIDELFKRRLLQERYKPDVQGYYLDKNIIFEIQISSDFITVIQAREEYYQSKGAYLIWVFNAFSTDSYQQTLAQKDIFYGNNRNAFCLTKECVKLSYQHNKLHLQVFYQEPSLVNDQIKLISPLPKIITLEDIRFNNDCTAFFYDFKENYKKCELELEAIQEERKKEREREEHRALLLDLADKMQNSPYWERQEFFREKCGLDFEYSNPSGLIQYVASAIKGRPTFIGGDNNKSLYRNTLNKNNRQVRRFFCYFHAVARKTKFYKDIPVDLAKKINDALVELQEKKHKSDYFPDRRYESVLKVFFPKAHQDFKILMWELGLEE